MRFHHERLRALRLDAGYAQEDLAAELGVAISTYRNFESGRVNRGGFSIRHVRRRNILLLMAQVLGLGGPEELLVEDAPPPRGRVDLSRLPPPEAPFVGREAELAWLDAALVDDEARLVALTGLAGLGRTALVGRWLARLAVRGFPGFPLVFAWSFHRDPSAEGLLDALGEALGRRLPAAPREAARQLAVVLQERAALLVLDGLDAHQSAAGSRPGAITDAGLRTLVGMLAARNAGLCVVTSRLPLPDLEGWAAFTARTRALEPLSAEDGAALLEALGLRGEPDTVAALVASCGGHPLLLRALASWAMEQGSSRLTSRHAAWRAAARGADRLRPVMEALAGSPAHRALEVLGVAGPGGDAAALDALLAPPPIPGLTEPLVERAAWQRAVARLRALRLVEPVDPTAPGAVRAWPIVRERFAEALRARAPETFAAAHGRLLEHHADSAPALPESRAQLQPVFVALQHACLAGRYDEALQLTLTRVTRGDELRAVLRFGALGECIGLLALLFDPPFSRLAAPLPPAAQAQAMSWVGRLLMGVGRYHEALPPLQAAWADASPRAVEIGWCLVEVLLFLGRPDEARALLPDLHEAARLAPDGAVARSGALGAEGTLRLYEGTLPESLACFEAADRALAPEEALAHPFLWVQRCSYGDRTRAALGRPDPSPPDARTLARDDFIGHVARLARARRRRAQGPGDAAEIDDLEVLVAAVRRSELAHGLLPALTLLAAARLSRGDPADLAHATQLDADIALLVAEEGVAPFAVERALLRARLEALRGGDPQPWLLQADQWRHRAGYRGPTVPG